PSQRMRDAENVRVCDWLRRKSGSQDIANDAPDSSCASPVRLDGTGVIVRLNFETHRISFVKRDHAGIVLKDAQAEPSGEGRGVRGKCIFCLSLALCPLPLAQL